jgi:hypothetical protein
MSNGASASNPGDTGEQTVITTAKQPGNAGKIGQPLSIEADTGERRTDQPPRHRDGVAVLLLQQCEHPTDLTERDSLMGENTDPVSGSPFEIDDEDRQTGCPARFGHFARQGPGTGEDAEVAHGFSVRGHRNGGCHPRG